MRNEVRNFLTELSERLCGIRYGNLPMASVEKTKLAILGYISGSFPGVDSDIAAAEKSVWDSQGAGGKCSVIAHKGAYAPLAAAAINAAMGQVFLQEDCHEETISHPGVSVIPTALAIAEANEDSGNKLIEAVVCGYEAQGVIGRSLIRQGFPKNGLRPAAILAPFGGAAAAAKLLGLNAEQTANALSIATSSAAGVMEFSITGTPEICIQNANGAKNGMTAALLAHAGLEGAASAFDGRFGLGIALNNVECDWTFASKPGHYEIDDTFIKIYPVCGHVIPTAQAIAEIVNRENLTADNMADSIRNITVTVPANAAAFPGVDNKGPFHGTISAMMSHQFAIAATLVFGEMGTTAVRRYSDARVAALAEKISVEADSAVSSGVSAKLRITLSDGSVIENSQNEVIPQTEDGVIARTYRFGEPYFNKTTLNQLINSCKHLEHVENVADVMRLLRVT